MTKKILVTFASRTGWTEGVAQAIGKTLKEDGAPAEVLPMRAVKSLEGYAAVVAGSGINSRTWLPEGMKFLRTHQVMLRRRPFAAFLVCMTMSMKDAEKYREHVRTWLEPVRALVTPVSEGLFAGGLEIDRVPSPADQLKFRISTLMGFWTEGDHRDWDAIRDWAHSLKPLLVK